jgi:hypothetical protein
MSDKGDERASQNTKLNGVLAETIRRRDAGEDVDLEAFCTTFPDLAPKLRSYVSGRSGDWGGVESSRRFVANTRKHDS